MAILVTSLACLAGFTLFHTSPCRLRGSGPQPGEALQPEQAADAAGVGGGATHQAPAAAAVVPDETIVAQLVSMGFGENGCRRAALATGNSNAEVRH